MNANTTPYLRALKLVRDELDYPSRELRLNSQVANCKEEMFAICEWLRGEVEKAIDLETVVDKGR